MVNPKSFTESVASVGFFVETFSFCVFFRFNDSPFASNQMRASFRDASDFSFSSFVVDALFSSVVSSAFFTSCDVGW